MHRKLLSLLFKGSLETSSSRAGKDDFSSDLEPHAMDTQPPPPPALSAEQVEIFSSSLAVFFCIVVLLRSDGSLTGFEIDVSSSNQMFSSNRSESIGAPKESPLHPETGETDSRGQSPLNVRLSVDH